MKVNHEIHEKNLELMEDTLRELLELKGMVG